MVRSLNLNKPNASSYVNHDTYIQKSGLAVTVVAVVVVVVGGGMIKVTRHKKTEMKEKK